MKKYLMMGALALTATTAFVSCSNEKDLYDPSMNAQKFIQDYQQAFIQVFGQPAANQAWGFDISTRATRSGNMTGQTAYPATHEYKDANGNVIAGANMNHNEWADPDTYYGGWLVPDALTEGQKLRVRMYFQANPNLSYEDPHYANFFVQQVYTGGTNAPETGNKESTKAADGTVHAGSTLNQLTVGEACSHINDFNAGTCSESNVLDNGQSVNGGTSHKDQITLMVNVDDTSCFGYHETGGSNVKGVVNHNDKMALVSAATIDAWAAANGNPGEAVTDKWNRSFMGFDYELLPEDDIIPENPTYAMLSAVPNINNIQYAWDGTTLYTIKANADASTSGNDLTARLDGIWGWNGKQFTKVGDNYVWEAGQYSGFGIEINANWSTYEKLVIEFGEATPMGGKFVIKNNNQDQEAVEFAAGATSVELPINSSYTSVKSVWCQTYGGGNLTINKIYLVGEAPVEHNLYYSTDYLLGEANKVMFYSSSNTNMYGGTIVNLTEDEMKTTHDGKPCLNLVKFNQLVSDGYHPISTDLKKWVKWEAACDGYYSDWIVTLTEAKRIGDDGHSDEITKIRVFGEDLSATEASDFDFNDVVFDAEKVDDTHVKITLWAAGGTLPLRIYGNNVAEQFEVHAALGTDTKCMTNTHAKDVAAWSAQYGNSWADNCKENQPYVKTITVDDMSVAKYAENFPLAVRDLVKVEVYKGEGEDASWYELTAKKGEPTCKIACVDTTVRWMKERKQLVGSYPNFESYVGTGYPTNWWSTVQNGDNLYGTSGLSVICDICGVE